TAAANAGFTLSNYPRRVYGFPHVSACNWLGLGTIGGGSAVNPSRAWVNGTYTAPVVAHEMGHNFGLDHSHSNTCDSTGCVVTDYGDDHDVMGSYTSGGQFNAYQKEHLGWLNYGTSPPIQTVSAVGPYTIEAYETEPGGLPKAIEVLKSNVMGSNKYVNAKVGTPAGDRAARTPGGLLATGSTLARNHT